MKIVMLEARSLGEDVDLSAYETLGDFTAYEDTKPEDTPGRIKDADIVVVNKIPMNEKTLGSADHLKLLCVTATGTNIVDMEYCRKRGITVTNVAGYSTYSVAQHTFALLFYVLEKLNYYDSYVKSGAYCDSPLFTHLDERFFEIRGKVWGIIGLGNIGREVAKIAEAFGCRVIYYSTTGKNSSSAYERVDLDTLLRTSDIVSIHAPLNAATDHLMTLEKFEKMKRSAILINVGRGPIVDEADLVKALTEGMIAGAGLDVLSVEPMQKDNPLRKLQDSRKLVITPHIAWASVEARQRLADETAENIRAWMRGEKRNVV